MAFFGAFCDNFGSGFGNFFGKFAQNHVSKAQKTHSLFLLYPTKILTFHYPGLRPPVEDFVFFPT